MNYLNEAISLIDYSREVSDPEKREKAIKTSTVYALIAIAQAAERIATALEETTADNIQQATRLYAIASQ